VEITDQNLIQDIRGGSQTAFDLLMQRYDKLVYRVAYKHTRAMDSALDITQNVFLKVYTRLDSFTGDGAFRSWLLRISHNESLDWIRKNARLKEQQELAEENMPQQDSIGEKEVEQRQFKQMLEQLLPKLSDKQQLAVSLRFFEDMSFREIAKIMDCSEVGARNILFRSMEKLRGHRENQQRVNYEQL
jgi:RNA polymerase sigma factor (sigma-70 family)